MYCTEYNTYESYHTKYTQKFVITFAVVMYILAIAFQMAVLVY